MSSARSAYDPGSQWGSGDLSTQDNTIRRKSTITGGDPDGNDDFEPELTAEWEGYPSDTFDGLGSHIVECGEMAPTVASTSPFDGAEGVATDANIDINFSEPVNVTGDWYAIQCGGSGDHTAAVSGGPQFYILNPNSDFVACEQCTVTVYSSHVTDQDTDDPPDQMEADYVFDFTTSCPCNEIYELQGFGNVSPCEGSGVNITGCVIGVTADGFYLQNTTGDGNPASSDGIYVYMYSGWDNWQNLEVGFNATVVGGEVQEYYGATEVYCSYTGCGQNGGNDVSKGGACTLPTPVEVQQITTLGDHDVNQYEEFEFMRVQMDIDGHVQGPTKRFVSRFPHGDPEIGFVYWDNVGSLPNSPRIFEADYAGYGSLNYLSGACNKDLPDVDFGDRIQATDLVGVMGYHFDKWQLILDESQTQDITVNDNPDISDSELPFAADEFGLCTFNLENLFDHIDDGDGDMGDWTPVDQAEYDAMLAIRAEDVVNSMQACSVIGVQEVEGKDPVWQDMVDAINTLLGEPGRFAYDYYESTDPRDITVGVLYDTNLVTLNSSTQRQGCTTTDYGISYANADDTYGRVVPNPCGGGTYPLLNRPPYVGTFQVTAGPEFTIIVNHFKSMRGGEEETRPRREAQAQHNADLANEYSITTPNVAVVGDLNDSLYSSPIDILNNATTNDGEKLINVYLSIMPQEDRYSYIFSGESGVLDYVFLSDVFGDYLKTISPLHINADFVDLEPGESDNCGTGICPFASTPRSSDHDPVFGRMGLTPLPVELAGFEAAAHGSDVRVTWETASEIDLMGFNLYRSTTAEGPYVQVNDKLIPAENPGAPFGATYTWWDRGLRLGRAYYYQLEQVDTSGGTTMHGPIWVTLRRRISPR